MRSACRRLLSDGPPVVAMSCPWARSAGRESRRGRRRAAVEAAVTAEGAGATIGDAASHQYGGGPVCEKPISRMDLELVITLAIRRPKATY